MTSASLAATSAGNFGVRANEEELLGDAHLRGEIEDDVIQGGVGGGLGADGLGVLAGRGGLHQRRARGGVHVSGDVLEFLRGDRLPPRTRRTLKESCSSVERSPVSSVGVAMARLGGGWRRARRRGATPGAARRARRGRSARVHPSAGTAGARDARDARTTTARRDVSAPALDPRAIAAAAAAGARHGAAVIMAIRFAPAKRRLQIIKKRRPSPRLESATRHTHRRARTLPPSGCPTRERSCLARTHSCTTRCARGRGLSRSRQKDAFTRKRTWLRRDDSRRMKNRQPASGLDSEDNTPLSSRFFETGSSLAKFRVEEKFADSVITRVISSRSLRRAARAEPGRFSSSPLMRTRNPGVVLVAASHKN